MASDGENLVDFFAREDGVHAANDGYDWSVYSQASFSILGASGLFAGRVGMEHPDLNSEELLQPADPALAGHGLPPLRRKGRSGAASFRAPRTEGGRTKTGRGACQGACGGGGRGKSVPSGSVSGGRVRCSIPHGAVGGGARRGPLAQWAQLAAVAVEHPCRSARWAQLAPDACMEPCRTVQWAVTRGRRQPGTAPWVQRTSTATMRWSKKMTSALKAIPRRGYKLMRAKYEVLSGLRHSSKQLRNRWTQLKSLYVFWMMLNRHIAFGRGPNGEIIASESVWRQACQEDLTRGDEDAPCDDSNGDGDGFKNSPMSTNNRKRGSNTTDTTTSPVKKSKSPMVKLMKDLIQEFRSEREQSERLGQQLVSQHERAQERAEQRLKE
ncbi:uncharacterized protein C2845_PM18G08100 [Panicum miliaceum]|uniref:Myb/SANT-like domain-containing protein n=1 Tax=Panicum miliaceum TaxID=4540 RepID=A0A3L6PHF2_PANMI|nr:uncharacterized protein C2845_PM18G08100 [Panicum miliaceum]